MARYSDHIDQLIRELTSLPGIGPRAAERIVFALLLKPKTSTQQLVSLLSSLHTATQRCTVCFNFSERSPCAICSSSQRDTSTICIVTKPQDISSIEKIGEYNGLYHVLGGSIDPLEGITPDTLTVKELMMRVQSGIKEVILAINPDIQGETTMLYLSKQLHSIDNLTVSRLARGLPIGGDVEYADEVTLGNALKRRDILEK